MLLSNKFICYCLINLYLITGGGKGIRGLGGKGVRVLFGCEAPLHPEPRNTGTQGSPPPKPRFPLNYLSIL
jgi:hypothetical protein